MAKTIIKPAGKRLLAFLGVIAVVFGLYYASQHMPESKPDENGKTEKSFFGKMFGGSEKKDYITIGTNTYAGFLYLTWLNNGLEPNEDCILYKEYGLKAKIVVQDDFQAGRAAFRNDEIDILYCTTDALPVEMSEGSDMADARYFYLSNWSRGADAIVANKNIKKVGDLIGKVVACSEGTASHTLLLNTLETNGIGYDKVHMGEGREPNKVNIKVVGSGLDAAAVFKSGECDAAVVFSPDDQDIVNTMKGRAWVLVSTKQASNIICDGLIAKQSYIDKNHDKLETLVSAFLYANSKMNTDEGAVKQAAQYFAKNYGTDAAFAIDGSKNIYYATLLDEANFFGLNPEFTGVQGSELYSKMARTYSGLNLCKAPLSWNKVSDSSIIEALLENPSKVKGDQKAEAKRSFTPATEAVRTANAISTKKVTIEYGTGDYRLSNDAKALIDTEFIPIIKMFGDARIRIEGNCDATGSDATNDQLSRLRAQSVCDYICRELNRDPNQFIVVGNGSSKAKRDGVQGDNQAYRTTDLEIITE